MIFDYSIIGAGIVGLATAWQLKKQVPKASILLLEKEAKEARHQTGHNSGVIHSGIYYKPGSYKAKNCVNGYKQLISFLKDHNIKYELCGKLIVATNKQEELLLDTLYKRANANGLENVRLSSFSAYLK